VRGAVGARGGHGGEEQEEAGLLLKTMIGVIKNVDITKASIPINSPFTLEKL
jgi:hypothetical protein